MTDEQSDDESNKILDRQRRSVGCPTYMSGFFGNFSSPNYPYNYPSYQRCSWRITVPSGYRVQVEFQTFYTHYSDYLRIYDGPSSSSPQLAYLSGYYYYRPVFYSSGRYLWFYFYSDCCSSRQGFLANFTAIRNFSSSVPISASSIQPTASSHSLSFSASAYSACPSSISGHYSGSFSSPNYPYNYPSYQRCYWRITVPNGYRVEVVFYTFSTAYPDSLSIYDGPSSSSRRLAFLRGYYYRPVFRSSGRYLWFYFYSDCCSSSQGFRASFTAISSYSSPVRINASSIQPSAASHSVAFYASVNSRCPSSIYGYSGSFSSPNYPYNYNNNQRCTWTVTVPYGRYVRVEFQAFDTEQGFDYLTIRDGSSSYSRLLKTLTGRDSCVVYSSGRSLWFEFRTDGSATRSGFYATFAAQNSYYASVSATAQCIASTLPVIQQSAIQPSRASQVLVPPASVSNSGCPSSIYGYSGSFSSPNYPNHYHNYQRCTWTVTVPYGYYVRVEFQAFDTEAGYDYLTIRDGSYSYSRLMKTFSGHYSCVVSSSGRSLWFEFRTDGSATRSGFYATFAARYSHFYYYASLSATAQCIASTSPVIQPSAIQPSRTSQVLTPSASSVNNSVPLECSNYAVLDEADRFSGFGSGWMCDRYGFSSGWYRFQGMAGSQMSEHCVPRYRCGSQATGWLNGPHPSVEEGIVRRRVCFNWVGCCGWSQYTSVRNCSGFYVYRLDPTTGCNYRYCGSRSSECPSSMSGYYSGSFSSPNFPENYTAGQSCEWSITVPSGYRVRVDFHTLELGTSDRLYVNDGPSSYSSHLTSFWGNYNSRCSVYSSGTSLWFRVRSYWWNGGGGRYYATYTAIPSSIGGLMQTAQCIQMASTPAISLPVPSPSIQPTPASRVPAPTSSAPFVLHLPANCEHSCVNTPGGFNCSCHHGYEIGFPYGRCQDTDECAVNNGGCSHHCTNILGGYYCSCAEGQTMSSDNHTCVEPGVTVQCGKNQMQLSLERRHFLSFDLKSLHLRHRDCLATSINYTHVTFSTLFNDCGTTFNESSDEIFFWNEVQADPVVISGVVSRMHGVSIPFYCAYNKKDLVSSVSYKPRRIVFAPEGGYGNMTFMMDLYHSASYSQHYGDKDYPVSVDVNQVLYVEYKVVSDNALLDVFAEKCWATPQPHPFTSPYYTFIENGCALDASLTSNHYSRSAKRFTIKAFRFFNFLDGYSTVYMHCELMACHVNTLNSRCRRGCQRYRRKKREAGMSLETPESESSRKYSLSTGPIVLMKEESTNNGGDTGQSKGALIGGTAAASGLVLVVFIALAVLGVKYRSVRLLMNRNKVGDMYAEENARKNAYVTEGDMGDEAEKDETNC